MSALSPILRLAEGNTLIFWCPGCDCPHSIKFGGNSWQWDGSVTKPTINPSVLIRSGHYAQGHEGPDCWCKYNIEHPEDSSKFECGVCHSFIHNGLIQFLDDCTHKLKGQTVPLPEWTS